MSTPSGPKSLAEHAMRALMGNLESIDSLGSLPYRLAKPILLTMTAEKLLEIEKYSPHLKDGDQEIWERLCVMRFDIKSDAENYKAPSSWRKYYHSLLAREKELEDEAGRRLREKYQTLNNNREKRGIVVTSRLPPTKRNRTNGWGKPTPSKTLFDQARSETRRKAGMLNGSSPSPSLIPLGRGTASPASGAGRTYTPQSIKSIAPKGTGLGSSSPSLTSTSSPAASTPFIHPLFPHGSPPLPAGSVRRIPIPSNPKAMSPPSDSISTPASSKTSTLSPATLGAKTVPLLSHLQGSPKFKMTSASQIINMRDQPNGANRLFLPRRREIPSQVR